MSVEKKLLKHPDGNFDSKSENKQWKKSIRIYRNSMSTESKKFWSLASIDSL
jgi:hypothetical protein